MSNEERAVLDFFAQEENLSLTLSVAELADGIRRNMNNAFWRSLHHRLSVSLAERRLRWGVQLTEDRNTPDNLVGLYLQPLSGQSLFLRLMLEQQHMGEVLRIYYGVMWSASPPPDKLQLAEVAALRNALQNGGFRNNENFLAWNWSAYHPRRKDFLQRYAEAADALLDEVGGLLLHFLLDHGAALEAANAALREAPLSATVSLDQLRASLNKGSS